MERLSKEVMMRIVGRLGDQIFFLSRVIVRTAGGYSADAKPKYIRDVTAVLGLEASRPVATPNVKKTPTTESLVELENEKRKTRNEPCTRQPWESCKTCVRSALTSCTA